MNRERRLGRGLEALLGHSPEYDEFAAATVHPYVPPQPGENPQQGETNAPPHPHDGLIHLGVNDVTPNRYQPRQDFDEADLDQLAESIRQHGVIQPIVVRRIEGGRMELISGERRLRAAIKAGWAQVPAWVREADDRQVAEIAIVENVQRKDLNPLEKAASFQRYLDTYGGSKEDLAARIQVDRSTVANLIRLLELPVEVQRALRAGDISQGHARALLPLGDDAEQVRYCQRIVAEQLSVRAVEDLITQAIRAADGEPLVIAGSTAVMAGASSANVLHEESVHSPRKPGTRSNHLNSLEQELRTALGTKVEIKETSRGRGKIIIHFNNQAEFERLREFLSGPEATMVHGEAG
jgi:ParB family chromosome partitioning protein